MLSFSGNDVARSTHLKHWLSRFLTFMIAVFFVAFWAEEYSCLHEKSEKAHIGQH